MTPANISSLATSGKAPAHGINSVSYDVLSVHVLSITPCNPASDIKVVKDALQSVLDRVEKPDGWAVEGKYTTGIPAYGVWAEALETGIAYRDGHAYLNRVWLECREHAVKFLKEAQARMPGKADDAFAAAIAHYGEVCQVLKTLYALYPDREQQDWVSMFSSPKGAELVREAAQAEKAGVKALHEISASL